MATKKTNMVVIIGPTAIGKSELAINISEQIAGRLSIPIGGKCTDIWI